MPLNDLSLIVDCHQFMRDDDITYQHDIKGNFLVAGIKPLQHFVSLLPLDDSEFFLEKREAGIVNIGGKGSVSADGVIYEMPALSCTYLGMGTTDVRFYSEDERNPALFLLISLEADFSFPNHMVLITEATSIPSLPDEDGGPVLVYIRPGGIQSCQLQMGIAIGTDPEIVIKNTFDSQVTPVILYSFNYDHPSFIWAFGTR